MSPYYSDSCQLCKRIWRDTIELLSSHICSQELMMELNTEYCNLVIKFSYIYMSCITMCLVCYAIYCVKYIFLLCIYPGLAWRLHQFFYFCFSMQVHVALDIIDEMCEGGFTLSTEVLHSMLQICEETCKYTLVWRIFHIAVSLCYSLYDNIFFSSSQIYIKICP